MDMDTSTLSPCDIRRPDHATAAVDDAFTRTHRAWQDHARYQVYRCQYGHPKRTVGAWLPLAEARTLAKQLDLEAAIADPSRVGCMSSVLHTISLHLPTARPATAGQAGDLVIHQVVEPVGALQLSAVQCYATFFLVGLVCRVAADGHVSEFVDRDGRHIRRPRKAAIVSGSEVDVPSALAGLSRREEEIPRFGVQFRSPDNALHFLQRFLINCAPTKM
jgi:hypothetical protein